MPLPKSAQESPQRSVMSLPGIASEDDDEDHDNEEEVKKESGAPLWVSSSILSKTLEMQSRVNPDDIFGTIQPIVIEEVFKSASTATKKFRPRSSSAHWLGTDKLTVNEIQSYNQNMGYHSSSSSS